MWYHSSGDTPDKQDPTQYKRAAVVGTGALAAIASGGDEMATRITSENLSRGTERLGTAERKGTSYLADATSPETLVAAWKEARVAIDHQAAVEKDVVNSSAVLYADPASTPKRLAAVVSSIDRTAAALLGEARAAYALAAQRLQTQPVYEPAMSEDEKAAANLIVECAAETTVSGCRGAGAGRGGGPGARPTGPSLPQHMNAELAILLGKHKSVLEIRDFLSGEFEPLPLADLMTVLRARETQGTITLVPK